MRCTSDVSKCMSSKSATPMWNDKELNSLDDIHNAAAGEPLKNITTDIYLNLLYDDLAVD